jgi:hypothetical protein
VKYDLSWSFYDRMDGRLLRKDLALGREEVRAIAGVATHLKLGGEVDNPLEMVKPFVFRLYFYTKRLGVGVTEEILVQGFGEEVEVLLVETAVPFVHELDLRGFERRHLGQVRLKLVLFEDAGVSWTFAPLPVG